MRLQVKACSYAGPRVSRTGNFCFVKLKSFLNMFDALSSKFGGILESLTRKGTLSEEDVGVAMREIRVALLEADVSLPVVKEFIEVVGQKAIGQDVVKSITPGQMVIKIVHDLLIEMLGSEDAEINFRASPPVPILIVGLQGADDSR